MANSTWQTFRKIDAEVITSFEAIVLALNATAHLTIHVAEGSGAIGVQLADATAQPMVAQLVGYGQALAFQYVLGISIVGGQLITLILRRTTNSVDQLTVQYPDQFGPEIAVPMLAAVSREFPTFARSDSLDRLLGDELANFYRARESGLLKLEGVTQKLITETSAYRQQLDISFDQRRKDLDNEFSARRALLEAEIESKRSELAQEESRLKELQKNIDDRESRHARRGLRVELQTALRASSEKFDLTEGTKHKRNIIHGLFIIALGLLGVLFSRELLSQSEDLAYYVRLGLTVATFGLILFLYIKWSDQWFRQHADEEFRLKRMSLDVDRASWVVETAMEWQQQNQSPIPAQLLEQLSRGLFTPGAASGPIRHPAEEFASAALSTSSSLKLNLPGGLGEATFDRKGVQRLKDAMSEEGEAK